jgi:hypothetical protein
LVLPQCQYTQFNENRESQTPLFQGTHG